MLGGTTAAAAGVQRWLHLSRNVFCPAAHLSWLQTFRREHDRFWILTAHPEVNLLAAGHDRWAAGMASAPIVHVRGGCARGDTHVPGVTSAPACSGMPPAASRRVTLPTC